MEQDEPETDTNDISLEDTLESLKRNAKALEVLYQETVKHAKHFQKQLLEESNQISSVPLQPRTRLMKWLTDRNLAVESTFIEFFEVFLREHKEEHRVDVSRRTIVLNHDACILFGWKVENKELSVYEILEKLNVLYY